MPFLPDYTDLLPSPDFSLSIQIYTNFIFVKLAMAFDLQSESDVKEYIEKLGIEYRFGCYSEKKPEGEIQIVFRSATAK